MARKYHQGVFKPLNPQKYAGNVTNIIFRSGWERKLMQYLDKHPAIVEWSSEETIVPYISPIDNRTHRYFLDFRVVIDRGAGKKETMLIEVKPKAQTSAPKVSNKITKRYLTEVQTWGVNSAKWEAAQKYCKARGWTFHIFTEDDLGIGKF